MTMMNRTRDGDRNERHEISLCIKDIKKKEEEEEEEETKDSCVMDDHAYTPTHSTTCIYMNTYDIHAYILYIYTHISNESLYYILVIKC